MDFSDSSMDYSPPDESWSETSVDSDTNGDHSAYIFGLPRNPMSDESSNHSYEGDLNSGLVSLVERQSSGSAISESNDSGSEREREHDSSYDQSTFNYSRDSDDDTHLNRIYEFLERHESRSESDSDNENNSFLEPNNSRMDISSSSTDIQARGNEASSSERPFSPDHTTQDPAHTSTAPGGDVEHQEGSHCSDDLSSSEEEEGGQSRRSRARDIARVLNNANGSYSQVIANSALEDMGSSSRTTNWESGIRSLDSSSKVHNRDSRPPYGYFTVVDMEEQSNHSSWNRVSSDSTERVGDFAPNISSSSRVDPVSVSQESYTTLDVSADVMERMNSFSRSNRSPRVSSLSLPLPCTGGSGGSAGSSCSGDGGSAGSSGSGDGGSAGSSCSGDGGSAGSSGSGDGGSAGSSGSGDGGSAGSSCSGDGGSAGSSCSGGGGSAGSSGSGGGSGSAGSSDGGGGSSGDGDSGSADGDGDSAGSSGDGVSGSAGSSGSGDGDGGSAGSSGDGGSPTIVEKGNTSEKESNGSVDTQNSSSGEGSPEGDIKSTDNCNSRSPKRSTSKDKSAKVPGSPASEDTCCICLGTVTDACVAGSCLHRFCFPCLKEWSQRKAECPLCKNKFEVIIHDIKGERDYKEHKVEVRTPNIANLMELSFSIMFGPRYNNAIMPSSYEHRLPRVRVPFNALTFRIRIYTNDLWVRFTTSNGTVRTCSPSVYREQPALTHRLVPFIRRDFRALRAPLSLVDTLMNLLIQHRIESVCMVRALTPHLHHKTRHFLHELNCFAHSSYDFVGYDSAVRTRYSDFSLREVPPLSVDVDEDLDEQLRQPESVEIDLTDDSTPNPPPSSTSQANSSGHSTTTTTTTRNLRLTIPSNTELTLTARPVPSSSGGGNQYVVVPPPTRLLPHEGYNDGSLGSSISRVRNTSLSGTANRHRLHLSTEMRERLKRKVISVRRQRQHPVRTSSSYVSSDAQSELANSTSSLTGLLNSYNNDESPSTTLVVSSSDEGGTTATNNDASLSMSDHNYTSNPVRAPCTCGAQKSSSKAPSKSCVCILPKPPVAASSDSEECLIVEERKSSRPVQSTSSRNNDIESIVLSDSSSSSEDERAETKQNTSSETIRPSITSGAKLKIASDASPLKKTKPVRLDRKSFSISDFEMKSSLRRRLKSPCRALDVEAKDEHSEAVSSTVLKTSTTSPTNSGFDESPAKREPKDDPSRIKRSFSSKTKVSAGSATASSSPSSSRSETYESTTNKIIPSYKNGVSIRQSSPVTVRVETRNPRVNVSSLFELPSSCRDSRMAKKSRERSKHSTSMERSHAKVTGNKRNYNSSDDEVRTSPTKYRELCFSSETESTLQSSLQPRKKKKRDSSKHRNSKSTSSSFLNIARAARPIISDSESDSSRHRHHGSNDGRISSGFKTSRHLMRLESDSDSDLDSSDSCSSRKRSRSTKRRHVDRSVSGSDRRSQRSLLIKDSDQSDSDRQSRSAKTKSKKKKRDRKKSKSRDRLSRHKRKKSGKSSHRRRRDSDS